MGLQEQECEQRGGSGSSGEVYLGGESSKAGSFAKPHRSCLKRSRLGIFPLLLPWLLLDITRLELADE